MIFLKGRSMKDIEHKLDLIYHAQMHTNDILTRL